MTKTIQELQDATQEGIKEWNSWRDRKESPKQAVMAI